MDRRRVWPLVARSTPARLARGGRHRPELAVKLLTLVGAASHLRAFVGLDGFVDEIVHVVDKRENAEKFQRLPTISALSQRISAAAGKSTNIELVVQRTKLALGPLVNVAILTPVRTPTSPVANWSRLVLPTRMAPAAKSFATTVAFAFGA